MDGRLNFQPDQPDDPIGPNSDIETAEPSLPYSATTGYEVPFVTPPWDPYGTSATETTRAENAEAALLADLNSFVNAAAPVTLNGTTAGYANWAQPLIGVSQKKVIVQLNGYENATASVQTITFPVSFTSAPLIVSQPSGFGATVTATELVLPVSMSAAVTGWVLIEGF